MNYFQWLSVILSWLFTLLLIYWVFNQETRIGTLNKSVESRDRILEFYIRSGTEDPEQLILELNKYMTENDSSPELLIHFQTLKKYLNNSSGVSNASSEWNQRAEDRLNLQDSLASNPKSLEDLDNIFGSMLSKNFRLIDSMSKYSDIKIEQEILKEASKTLEEATIQISKTTSSQSWKMVSLKSPEGLSYRYVGGINKAGLPNGFGVATYDNGDIFRGSWMDGFQEGSGKWMYNNGDEYDGNFVKGKRNGFGVFSWKNGEIYTGYWSADRKNGKGILTRNETIIESGQWKADKLIKSEIIRKDQFPSAN